MAFEQFLILNTKKRHPAVAGRNFQLHSWLKMHCAVMNSTCAALLGICTQGDTLIISSCLFIKVRFLWPQINLCNRSSVQTFKRTFIYLFCFLVKKISLSLFFFHVVQVNLLLLWSQSQTSLCIYDRGFPWKFPWLKHLAR